jgi:hypothetical protein
MDIRLINLRHYHPAYPSMLHAFLDRLWQYSAHEMPPQFRNSSWCMLRDKYGMDLQRLAAIPYPILEMICGFGVSIEELRLIYQTLDIQHRLTSQY